MKHLSVTTFIHTLFIMVIGILIGMFLLFNSLYKDRQKIEELKRYQLIALTFLSKLQLDPDKEELQKLYKELHLRPVSPKRYVAMQKRIQEEGETIFSGNSKAGSMRVFRIGNRRYVFVQRMSYNLLLEDRNPKNYVYEIALTIGVFLIVLILLLYFAVLKKLYPLKKLHRQIQRFAHGDMNVRIAYEQNDEIGKIAKSFDEAIRHINELSQSKNLFMRNVMHELKTPITKGRIAVEMVEDETTKQVLVRAFERMNELINELAEIERVTMQGFEPKFEYLMLDDLVRESRDMLMVQNGCVKTRIDAMGLTTDRKLFTLVLKNLMDNGIKYGKDRCVEVRTRNGRIEVVSLGDALEHPLEYYTEPFSQAEKRSSGFGLGLYIVHTLLQKLGYAFYYRHEAGENIFTIDPQRRLL